MMNVTIEQRIGSLGNPFRRVSLASCHRVLFVVLLGFGLCSAIAQDQTVNGSLSVAGEIAQFGNRTKVISSLAGPNNNTDSYRYEIGRMGVNQVHWGFYGVVTIELTQTYYAAGAYQKWYVKAGNGDFSGSATLVERFGDSAQFARVVLGAPVLTGNSYSGYPNQYIPIYVDASDYTRWKIKITHSWTPTSNDVPEYSQLRIFDSPAQSTLANQRVVVGDVSSTINGVFSVRPSSGPAPGAYVQVGQASYGLLEIGIPSSSDNKSFLSLHRGGAVAYQLGISGDDLALAQTGGANKDYLDNVRLRIASNGNVGIGTASPANRLSIAGALEFDPAVTGVFAGSGSGVYTPAVGELSFVTGGSQRLRVSSAGNVGIGTTTPAFKLDVLGNTNIQGSLTVTGAFAASSYTAASGSFTGGSSGLVLNAGGTNQNVTISASGTGSVVLSGDTTVNGGTLYAPVIASGTSAQMSSKRSTAYVNGLVDGGSGTPQYYTIGTLDLSSTIYTSGVVEGLVSVGRSYQSNPEYRFRLTYFKVTGTATASLSVEYTRPSGAPTLKVFRNGDIFKLVALNDHANQAGLFYDITQYQGDNVIGAAWIQLATSAAAVGSNPTPPAGFTEIASEFISARLKDNGYVGIGTANPDKPLTVKGAVHATEVVVDTTIAAKDLRIQPEKWADDVFDTGHRLTSLSEVEQHINSHKHLPGIPSAEDVAAKGINLAQIVPQLLATIEELTLHQIEQEKAVASAHEKIAQLEAANTGLAREMARLQSK